MKPLRLFCPAEDHTWSQTIQTERELQICKDIASRLGLAIRLDEANGKLFLGRGHKQETGQEPRRINAAGLKLIKESEGCELTAYQDPVGVWTIGYGHTGPDVTPGLIISQAKADQLLQDDLRRFEKSVADQVTAPITDNQFAALVSFAYNLGPEALRDSTLLRKLNAGDYQGASQEFAKWVHAGGQKLPGLVTRRERERKLFLDGAQGPATVNVSVAAKVRPLAQQTPDTCGLASAAMAINCLTGLNYTDLSLRERYGYALLAALNGECPKHRWESPDFTPVSWALIEQSLQAGRPVLFAANGPDFSASGRGHILLIVALKGDQVQMADPNGGVFRWWTRSQCEEAPPHPQGKWLMVASKR